MPRPLDLLSVCPEQVVFEKVDEGAVASLRLQNLSREIVAFKLQTTAPQTYNVHPNAGVVPVGDQTVEIEIRIRVKSARAEVEADKFLLVAHSADVMRPLSREQWKSIRADDLQERKLQVVCREAEPIQARVTADTLHAQPTPLEQKYDDLLVYTTDLEARLCASRGQRDELLKEVAKKRGFSLPMIFIFALITFLAARLIPLQQLDGAPQTPQVERSRDAGVVGNGVSPEAEQPSERAREETSPKKKKRKKTKEL